MQSLIYRHTTVRGVVETTTLYIFGVPIYRHRYIGDKEEARKPCGFQYYGVEMPRLMMSRMMRILIHS